MGREEDVTVEVARCRIGHHDEEAGMLEMQVGVGIDEGEVAQLHACRLVLLDGKAVQLGQEVGRRVL